MGLLNINFSTNDGFDTAYTNFILFLIKVTDAIIKPLVSLRLRWATASLDPSDCATYTVHIRYHCVNQEFVSETELVKYQELCDELIPKVSILMLKKINCRDKFLNKFFILGCKEAHRKGQSGN